MQAAADQARVTTLDALVEALTQRGDALAVLAFTRDGPRRWSYAELAAHSRRMAGGVLGQGVRPGDAVGVFAGERPEWIAAVLGILRAGAMPVPIDVQLDDRALQHVLEDSGTGLVITDTVRRERLRRLDVEIPRTLVLDAPRDADSWTALPENDPGPPPAPDPDTAAILFYTSGTTGLPKGVPLSHANIAYQLQTLIEAELVTSADRVLLPLPLHHVYPLVCGMLTPLALGLPLITPQGLTGPLIMRALREGRPTLLIGVPRLYEGLVTGIQAQAAARGRLVGALLSAAITLSAVVRRHLGWRLGRVVFASLHRRIGPDLRVLASGGAALAPELAYRLQGLGWEIATGYGLTETAPLLTLNLPGRSRLEGIGTPVPGTELRSDPSVWPQPPDPGEAPPPARGTIQAGEIQARGPGVFRGYRNAPDKSAEAFTADGWFRTGDLGYMDDAGYWYILGRVSTLMVTSGGKNIQPDPLEAAYLEHPAIREVGVLQDDAGRLVAVAVPEPDVLREHDPETTVRDAIQARGRTLPSYQRVADVVMSEQPLPRTRLGKIQRHLLREHYATLRRQGAPAVHTGPMPLERMSGEDRALLEHPAPRAAWAWLADRYPDRRLTPDSSLDLDLGVDSVEWINLTLELGQQTGVELDEQDIADVQTVRDLLQAVSASGPGDAEDILSRPEQALEPGQRRWIAPLGTLAAGLSSLLYGLNRTAVGRAFEVKATGLKQLPSGPCVLAPNHLSLLDAPALAAVLEPERLRQTYWGGWTGIMFRTPLRRAFSRLAHAIPVEPRRGALAGLALGAAVLRRGRTLVWFPEGERSLDGMLQPFKPGLGILLERVAVPVVPIFIRGTREALPPRRRWPRRRPVSIEFGPPLDPQQLAAEGRGGRPAERIVAALHQHMAAMAAGGTLTRSAARRRA